MMKKFRDWTNEDIGELLVILIAMACISLFLLGIIHVVLMKQTGFLDLSR